MESALPYQKLLEMADMIGRWADYDEAGGLKISPVKLRKVSSDIRAWVDEHCGKMERRSLTAEELKEFDEWLDREIAEKNV